MCFPQHCDVAEFLADRTAACNMISYCHDNVFCLSVRPSVCDAVHCG